MLMEGYHSLPGLKYPAACLYTINGDECVHVIFLFLDANMGNAVTCEIPPPWKVDINLSPVMPSCQDDNSKEAPMLSQMRSLSSGMYIFSLYASGRKFHLFPFIILIICRIWDPTHGGSPTP